MRSGAAATTISLTTNRFNRIGEWECFDHNNYPRALNNVYAGSKYADTVSKLKGEMTRLRRELDDHDLLQDVPKGSALARLRFASVISRSALRILSNCRKFVVSK
ncbi:MAG: hypothetical protein MUF81_02970 [Verrucomicrobia bacterium]|nr:hypothetical protein [Verrucomicrobiota bacterium]